MPERTIQSKLSCEADGGREERRVTLWSIWVNAVLTLFKFAAGIFGQSQALLADAVHSLSDFATDFAVLAGLRLSSKPRDSDHAYGHGKYETLTAAVIGLALLFVSYEIAASAIRRIFQALHGQAIPMPAVYAFWMAVASIVVKEALYHATIRVARRTRSAALEANAWHHRSDALSSIATAAGVGAAAMLGDEWLILDPIAALFVSLFLFRVAFGILRKQIGTLTEKSLEPATCREILEMARGIPGVREPHNLRTRMVGRTAVIDLHICFPPEQSLHDAHELATRLEVELKGRFGEETIVTLHLEPYPEG